MAADLGFLSDKGPVDDRTAAQWAYETLRASFPNIRGEPADGKRKRAHKAQEAHLNTTNTDHRLTLTHRSPPDPAPLQRPRPQRPPRQARPRTPVRPGARGGRQPAQVRGPPPDQVRAPQRARLRRHAPVAGGRALCSQDRAAWMARGQRLRAFQLPRPSLIKIGVELWYWAAGRSTGDAIAVSSFNRMALK